MSMNLQMTAPLGDVVVAAFDQAAHYVSDPDALARLAAHAVRQMRRRGDQIDREALAMVRSRMAGSRMSPASSSLAT